MATHEQNKARLWKLVRAQKWEDLAKAHAKVIGPIQGSGTTPHKSLYEPWEEPSCTSRVNDMLRHADSEDALGVILGLPTNAEQERRFRVRSDMRSWAGIIIGTPRVPHGNLRPLVALEGLTMKLSKRTRGQVDRIARFNRAASLVVCAAGWWTPGRVGRWCELTTCRRRRGWGVRGL